jgi:hypothetical protein
LHLDDSHFLLKSSRFAGASNGNLEPPVIHPVFRIARGIGVSALSWSIVWGIAGALLRVLHILPGETDRLALSMVVATSLGFAQVGAIVGGLFAGTLAIAGPRVLMLSARSMALRGAAAATGVFVAALALNGVQSALRLPGYFTSTLVEWVLLSGGCAVATMALARRGEPTAVPRAIGGGPACK